MPYQNLRIKQKVKVGEKYGVIMECGDKYKVKFDDGDFGFYAGTEVTPIVLESETKGNKKYNRMKAESEKLPGESFMQPTATGTDPLAQPVNDTGSGVGEPQNVLGKEVAIDKISRVFKYQETNGGNQMAKKKVLEEDPASEEEVEKQDSDDDSEEEKKKKSKKEESEEDVEKEDSEEDDVEKEEDLEEDEDEEEKKKKKKSKLKAKKGEAGSGESPEEDTASATDSNSTITPNMSTPSDAQDVFVPPSVVDGKREQETPMGKSVNPDLMKSPLFVSLSGQIDGIRDAVEKKVDALQKSVNDRLSNVQKDMEKIEKFYEKSFYKAIDENVAPESTQAMSVKKQMELGKVRFKE